MPHVFTKRIFRLYQVYSQPIEGTTGLLKIPSAEMQADGTFIAGANYLPDAITPVKFNYITGNYFFNITFLPFMEFTYRATLMRWEENHNQDRSFGLRFRLLKESKILPSIVLGGNDLLGSNLKPGILDTGVVNDFFSSIFIVGTKHFMLCNNRIGFTLGIGNGGVRKTNLNGVFGGVSLVPAFLPSMRLIADYDAEVISAGAEVLFFKHLYLFGMAYD
ncbi:MAG TPA: hypothetical protein DCR40_11395 [Prolixibacteraceae bacterium]|nr:hypothetical protein [Prolixibacteraceae bacterium]